MEVFAHGTTIVVSWRTGQTRICHPAILAVSDQGRIVPAAACASRIIADEISKCDCQREPIINPSMLPEVELYS